MNETINQRISRLRKSKGYTQLQVADKLNIKLSTYSQMERKGGITSDIIIKLSEILEVDPLIILYGENHIRDKAKAKTIQEIEKEIDIPEISFLVTKNLYEKLTIIAMRRLPTQHNRDIYQFVLEKLKSL